jgi:hypothetical protein
MYIHSRVIYGLVALKSAAKDVMEASINGQ